MCQGLTMMKNRLFKGILHHNTKCSPSLPYSGRERFA